MYVYIVTKEFRQIEQVKYARMQHTFSGIEAKNAGSPNPRDLQTNYFQTAQTE